MLNEEPVFLPVAASAAPVSRRWETIAAALREDIVQGLFAPGSRLPNEAALAERFQVNRHTLRQAMQSLAREGFVQVRHGSGTFVRELVLDYALQRRTRMSENLAEAGEQGRRELLSHRQCPAGSRWAGGLHINPHAQVLQMRTRALVRGRPVSLSTAAYPLPRLNGMAEAFTRLASITAALAELGVADYTRARSVISSRLPSQEEADALARPVTQPVLVVDYSNVDAARLDGQAGWLGAGVNAGPASLVRYAVYWVPEPAHALAQMGEQWLSQDPAEAPIAEPALYGCHATLKPPFRLAAGCHEADVLAAVQALAQGHQGFDMPALRVARLHDFLALRPLQALEQDHALWRLADACVSELDFLRQPASEAELQKRRSAGLDPQQEALLLCWGYPHVLARWRFHMTLSNAVFSAQEGGLAAAALQTRLQALFASALGERLRCEAICVFRQDAPGQAFCLSHRFRLGASMA